MKPDSWLKTLNCAIEGILCAVRTQRHMRWHLASGTAVLLVMLRVPLSPAEAGVLCLCVAFVLMAELVNTALEAVVDLASPGFHELARRAKDVAAGAVLVAALAAAVVGWIVLFPKLSEQGAGGVHGSVPRAALGVAATLVAVLFSVVLLKATFGRGTPLHGGFPSGHAALSFSMATLSALHSRDLLISLLAGALAVLVSHSRLLLRIHTWGEVLAGAALGVAVTLLLSPLTGSGL